MRPAVRPSKRVTIPSPLLRVFPDPALIPVVARLRPHRNRDTPMTATQATADENFDEGCRTSQAARPVTVADAASALAPLDLAVLRRLPADELEQQLEARWAL